LPVDLLSGPTGEPLYGEASIQGKKKDAVIACALDACKILDKHDLLRKSTHGKFLGLQRFFSPKCMFDYREQSKEEEELEAG
jgi:hypothetical protein